MKKILTSILIIGIVAINSFAALVISNVAATSITTTSMVFNATVASTNGTGTNPTCTLFYGTVDYTTNANSWAYSNVYGVAGLGNISTQITGLSASRKYYFAWRAVEGATTDWATPSLSAWTKPTAPTSTPAVVTISVQTDTDGVLKAPTNFFDVNSNLLIAALGPQGDSNAVWGNITGTLAAQTDLQSALDGKASTGTVAAISLDFGAHTNNEAADIQHLTATQVGALTNELPVRIGAVEAKTSEWDTASVNASAATNSIAMHVSDTANPHAVTAVQVGAVPTNDAKYLAALTNETYLGTITGATIAAGSSDSVVITGPNAAFTWNTNAAGGGGGGTITNILSSDSSVAVAESGGPQPDLSVTSYVAGVVADYVSTSDPTYQAIETNRIALQDGSNISWRVDGTNVYPDLDPAIPADIIALKASTNALNAAYPIIEGGASVHVTQTPTGQVLTVDAGAVDYGVTDSTAYRGDWGNAVSGQVVDLQTATGSLNTAVGNLETATNALNTRADNLESATNNLNTVANAALPKSSTNDLAVTEFEITGNSPTNGAVWIATNTEGAGKWSRPVGFCAFLSSDYNFTNALQRTITWSSESFDVGNNFNLTTFTAPVAGLYRFYFYIMSYKISGGTVGNVFVDIVESGALKLTTQSHAILDSLNTVNKNEITLLLTNGAPVYLRITGTAGHTNAIYGNSAYAVFGCDLNRELP
jgi:hypothetical protein